VEFPNDLDSLWASYMYDYWTWELSHIPSDVLLAINHLTHAELFERDLANESIDSQHDTY